MFGFLCIKVCHTVHFDAFGSVQLVSRWETPLGGQENWWWRERHGERERGGARGELSMKVGFGLHSRRSITYLASTTCSNWTASKHFIKASTRRRSLQAEEDGNVTPPKSTPSNGEGVPLKGAVRHLPKPAATVRAWIRCSTLCCTREVFRKTVIRSQLLRQVSDMLELERRVSSK